MVEAAVTNGADTLKSDFHIILNVVTHGTGKLQRHLMTSYSYMETRLKDTMHTCIGFTSAKVTALRYNVHSRSAW